MLHFEILWFDAIPLLLLCGALLGIAILMIRADIAERRRRSAVAPFVERKRRVATIQWLVRRRPLKLTHRARRRDEA